MNKSYLTAITRKTPSVPTTWLLSQRLLVGRTLDYGSGKGTDSMFLGIESYDPHFQPDLPSGKFDTIICIYVLNVMEEAKANEVVVKVKDLLNPNGRAYFAVRRDIKKEGITSRNTFQRNVILDLPIIRETSSYCIYSCPKSSSSFSS